ncbi:MAG: hypothetical protein OXU63_11255, partial [Acidobacteriota bacterium]|nr:hypothetical protein [Acidobacteriota bacterium]
VHAAEFDAQGGAAHEGPVDTASLYPQVVLAAGTGAVVQPQEFVAAVFLAAALFLALFFPLLPAAFRRRRTDAAVRALTTA